jgi:hypothetical protein
VKAIPLLALLLVGCASGPPTVTLDAAAFVGSYMRDRDDFRDRTAAARIRCARYATAIPKALTAVPVPSPPPANLDALKAKCATLEADLTLWAARDAAILDALLTRETINAETLKALWPIVEKVLTIAADILL